MGFLIAAIITAAILCLRISISIVSNGEFSLAAKIGFVKINIFPTKEKKIKLSDYKTDKFRKKSKKNKKVSAQKIQKEKKPKKNVDTESEPEEKRDIPALIKKIIAAVEVFVKRFGKHLRIDLNKVVIIIATGDAAKTALIYGASIGVAQNLYSLLVSTNTLHTNNNSEFIVEPDFLSEESKIEVDLKFSFRIWQLLDMAIRALVAFLKNNDE